MARAWALVIGPLGTWGVRVESMGMLVGFSAPSPPPSGKIRSRIGNVITMVRGQVGDVESITHRVLVEWDVNLVGIIVDPLYHLEGAIDSR